MDIESIQRFCLNMPHVTEQIKWDNDLVFMVAGKMFCIAGLDFPHNIAFKCTPEKFQELIERSGIIPAPYMARAMWVQVQDTSAVSPKELEQLIIQARQLVFEKLPKKLQASLTA